MLYVYYRVMGIVILRLYNRCAEYGLSEPLFEEFGDGIKVTLFRKVGSSAKKVSSKVLGAGSGRYQLIELY